MKMPESRSDEKDLAQREREADRQIELQNRDVAKYRVYCREYGLDPDTSEAAANYERDYEWWSKP
jgi:hypothetical protein